jgi:hypothetical protein
MSLRRLRHAAMNRRLGAPALVLGGALILLALAAIFRAAR